MCGSRAAHPGKHFNRLYQFGDTLVVVTLEAQESLQNATYGTVCAKG